MLHHTALVRTILPVLDERFSVTWPATPTQFRVEPFEDTSGDLADGHPTQRRTDVQAQIRLVALPSRFLDLVHFESLFNGVAKGGLGAGTALLGHLRPELGTDLLRLCQAGGRLGKVEALAGDRVAAGEHGDLQ
jgi:hypothetical protein